VTRLLFRVLLSEDRTSHCRWNFTLIW